MLMAGGFSFFFPVTLHVSEVCKSFLIAGMVEELAKEKQMENDRGRGGNMIVKGEKGDKMVSSR